jgi:hypothetical protein
VKYNNARKKSVGKRSVFFLVIGESKQRHKGEVRCEFTFPSIYHAYIRIRGVRSTQVR